MTIMTIPAPQTTVAPTTRFLSFPEKKSARKEQILRSLATMLTLTPCSRVTTAGLAKEVGVSEAALYRHFPSKAKMFEGLIEYIEHRVFTMSGVQTEDKDFVSRIESLLRSILLMAEETPGVARMMTGDALSGEHERLQEHLVQFYQRVETQLQQWLEANEDANNRIPLRSAQQARLLLAVIEGRLNQFVRGQFIASPLQDWTGEWNYLKQIIG